MKHHMQVIDNIVRFKGHGENIPVGNYEISHTQYNENIRDATVNALPTYNEDGSILTDADLTEYVPPEI